MPIDSTDPTATAEPTESTTDPLAEIDARINRAFSAREKRLEASFRKMLADSLATVAPARAEAPKGPGDEPSPEVKTLRQQMAELQRRHEDAEARARATELKAARDTTRAHAREQLEARGIKGARASAVIAHLEATGQLAYADDGRASVVVRRVRSKGALAPEELTHDDLASGIDDWAKTAEAAEFLPPPAPAKPVARAAPPAPVGVPGSPGRPLSLSAAVDAALAAVDAGTTPNR